MGALILWFEVYSSIKGYWDLWVLCKAEEQPLMQVPMFLCEVALPAQSSLAPAFEAGSVPRSAAIVPTPLTAVLKRSA